jgi:adenine-specific DNA-methyltransferase
MKRRLRRHYSADNRVTLFPGDCLDLLKTIPAGSARLVLTSPPYNVGKSYETSQSLPAYLQNQRKIIAECVRITSEGGSICWQIGHHVNGHSQVIPLDLILHPLFAEYEQAAGIRLRNRIVWHFEHGLHCKRRFSGRYETILWYTKGDDYVFNLDAVRVPQKYPGKRAYKGPNRGKYSGNPLGKNPSDVWIFPNVKANHTEKTAHPCQFPIELAERFILALTHEHELVVDPFLGSGTTAVAAILLNRRAAGAELVRSYFDIARYRIQLARKGTVPRRPRAKPVYVPKSNTPLTIIPAEFARDAKPTPAQLRTQFRAA